MAFYILDRFGNIFYEIVIKSLNRFFHQKSYNNFAFISELTSKEIAFYNHYLGKTDQILSSNTSLLVRGLKTCFFFSFYD